MQDDLTQTPEDYAQRGLRYTRDQFQEIMHQTEDYVREKPAQSLLYAVAAGFILNKLPVFRIFGGLVRLLLVAFKPAILIYGATKIYQASQEDK